MPNYEFKCKKCNKSFSLSMSISEYSVKKPKCPKCGSRSVTPQLGGFFAKTSKKG